MKYFISFLGVLLCLALHPCASGQGQRIKVACIGNSVTYGYGLKDPKTQSYPSLLAEKLGDSYAVQNFGHSGATLLRNGHNPYFKTPEFTKMMQFHPNMAIIHLGLNDTDPRDFPNYRDEFTPDYNWLIDTIRKSNPGIKIFICKMTPIFTGHPRFMSSTFIWQQDLQKRIEQVAKINHVQLIDLYSAFHDRPDLFTDAPTLHPNAEGAKKLSEVIYQNISGNFGGLKLPEVFSDNMILQRDEPIRIWGTANAGTVVKITFHGLTKSVTTQFNGTWAINFPSLKSDLHPQQMLIENQGQKINFHNILIGDLWLCGGQSNMAFPLNASLGGEKEGDKADSSGPVRLFHYKPYAETDMSVWDSTALARANNLNFFSGSWKENERESALPFSAVGYYFGNKIQKEVGVPIGLIEVAVGGSPLISWLDRYTLESNALFEPALHDWRHSDYIMEWCRQRADVNLKDAKSPFQRHSYDPCYNFEAGLSKIIPLAIKGIIWYQGESDADNAELYQKLMPVFVKDLRDSWKQNLPFFYVQLSSINRPSWNYFRDIQRQLLKQIPNSGMVVTSDLGDTTNVHYINKAPVGLRMADLVLNKVYSQKNITPNGPLVQSAKIKGGYLYVQFSQSDGMHGIDGQKIRGFQLIDKKGNFVDVDVKVQNEAIVIKMPTGVNYSQLVYGWKPFTRANLINNANLPASTFMIDIN